MNIEYWFKWGTLKAAVLAGVMGILASAWHLFDCHPCEPQTLFFIFVLVVMSLLLIITDVECEKEMSKKKLEVKNMNSKEVKAFFRGYMHGIEVGSGLVLAGFGASANITNQIINQSKENKLTKEKKGMRNK